MNEKTVNEKIALFFGIKEEAWTSDLVEAWKLAQKCNELDSGIDFIKFRETLAERATLLSIGYDPYSAASLICESLLATIDQTPKCYEFTHAQLYSMLKGTIEMFLEYQRVHSQGEESAKTSACLEVIDGLDADQDLTDWDVAEKAVSPG